MNKSLDENLDGLDIRKREDGMWIVGYLGNQTSLTLPTFFNGQVIVGLGQNSFAFNGHLESVCLPEKLRVIEKSAFSSCTNLKTVNFFGHLKEINTSAFFKCTKLEELHFPPSLEKVGQKSFFGCTSLRHVWAEGEETKACPTTFGDCSALEDMSFSLLASTHVSHQTLVVARFLHLWKDVPTTKQTEVIEYIKRRRTLQKSLFIHENAAITSLLLTFPLTLTQVMVNQYLDHSIAAQETEKTALFLDYKHNHFTTEQIEAFEELEDLVNIGLEYPTLKQFKAKWRCKHEVGGLVVSGYKGNGTHEVLPPETAEGVKVVGLRAFSPRNVGNLKHLDIKAEITTLVASAFAYCENLESVILPDTIKTIEPFTFLGCKNLKEVTFPSNIRRLSEKMFYRCESLERIDIPDSVKYLGSEIFKACVSLEEVELPPRLKKIPTGAFGHCNNLKTVKFTDSVKSVGAGAFFNCSSLENLYIPPKTKVKNKFTFQGCPKLADAEGFTIYNGVLYEMTQNSGVISIPEGVTRIMPYTAYYSQITELILPDSMRKICKGAFSHCSTLETVTLNEGLRCIGISAFTDCSKLASLNIPSTLKFLGDESFYNSPNLANEDGFFRIGDILVGYYGEEKKVLVPKGIVRIGSRAFFEKNLEEVVFPSTLECIGRESFKFCHKLSKVNIPKNLKSIEASAFAYCNVKVKVPPHVNVEDN